MKETRNFLRYLVPGLLLIFEILMLIFASGSHKILNQLPDGLKNYQNLSASIIILLVSGCLGYVLSIIHHCFYWWRWCKSYPRADYRDLIKRAEMGGRIKLYCQGCEGPLPEGEKLSRRGAWNVVTAIWHSRKKIDGNLLFGNALARADSLSDLMHGAGSTYIASLLAAITWLIIFLIDTPEKKGIAKGIALAVALVVLHRQSYSMIVKHAQSYIGLIFYESITYNNQDHNQGPKPLGYYVSKDELEED